MFVRLLQLPHPQVNKRIDGQQFTDTHGQHIPPTCASTNDLAFRAGCEEARKRLNNSDLRRHQEADYKAVWNAPLDASGVTVLQQPRPKQRVYDLS
jgi:hypothetical protein